MNFTQEEITKQVHAMLAPDIIAKRTRRYKYIYLLPVTNIGEQELDRLVESRGWLKGRPYKFSVYSLEQLRSMINARIADHLDEIIDEHECK